MRQASWTQRSASREAASPNSSSSWRRAASGVRAQARSPPRSSSIERSRGRHDVDVDRRGHVATVDSARAVSVSSAARSPRAHRAVHVPVPDGGRLGAGPVDPAHGLAERLRVARPHARPHAPAVAAARELLRRPVLLDVLDRVQRTLAEVLRKALECQRAPLVGVHQRGGGRVLALEEAEQHAAAQVLRAVVEHDADRIVEADDEAREPVLAPERLVVADLDLDHGAHRHLLREVVAPAWERGAVADAARRAPGAVRRSRARRARGRARAGPRRRRRRDGSGTRGSRGARRRRAPPPRAARSPGCRRRCGCPGRRRRWPRACRSCRRSGRRTRSAAATSGRCRRRRSPGSAFARSAGRSRSSCWRRARTRRSARRARGRWARPRARRAGRSPPSPRARPASRRRRSARPRRGRTSRRPSGGRRRRCPAGCRPARSSGRCRRRARRRVPARGPGSGRPTARRARRSCRRRTCG